MGVKFNHRVLLNCFIKDTCLRWLWNSASMYIYLIFYLVYMCKSVEFPKKNFIVLDTCYRLWKDFSNYSKFLHNGVLKLGKLTFSSMFKIAHPSVVIGCRSVNCVFWSRRCIHSVSQQFLNNIFVVDYTSGFGANFVQPVEWLFVWLSSRVEKHTLSNP